MKVFLQFVVLLFCLSSVKVGFAEDQVRVLLDTSISMRKAVDSNPPQDPAKLSVLSVKLLTDLLYPVFSKANNYSYEIFTFNNYGALPANGFPQHKTHKNIDHFVLGKTSADWNVLQAKLSSINRNAGYTYFYPGLREIVSSFGKSRENDTRIIILITDGNSDSKNPRYNGSPAKYEKEKEALNNLAIEMNSKNIKLFILAFGSANDVSFFQAMTDSDSIGEVLAVNSPDDLMQSMAKIFADNFGYMIEPSSSPYYTMYPAGSLNLGGSDNNKIVGVLSIIDDITIPDFELSPSTGAKPVNIYNNTHKGETVTGDRPLSGVPLGGGYKLRWLDKPSGKFNFSALNPSSQKVIVLKPLEVDVAIGGVGKPDLSVISKPNTLIEIMAERSEEIYYFAKTAGVDGRKPTSDLEVEFARRKGKWDSSSELYSGWNTIAFSSASICTTCSGLIPLSSKVAKESLWYHEDIKFPSNEKNPSLTYEAKLPVQAKLKNRVVGATDKENAKNIRVFPFMSFNPQPLTIDLKNIKGKTLLAKGETACANFKIKPSSNNYFEEFKNEITINAILIPFPTTVVAKKINLATFTLDGKKIENPSSTHSIFWEKTYKPTDRSTLDQLTKGTVEVSRNGGKEYTHKICMTVGRPIEGGKIQLNLNFIIKRSPYDRGDVIQPLTVRLKVEEPSWVWWKWLWLLLLLLLLWLLKFIPKIEDDLRYTYDKEGAEKNSELHPLELSPLSYFFRRLLNLVSVYELNSTASGQSTIALIKPVANDSELDDLYVIKLLKSNSSLRSLDNRANLDGTNDIKTEGSWKYIHVNKPYRLGLDGDEYIFRLEYDNE